MGVIECSRNNCKSILCDTYIDGVGYICNDCQKEFKRYLRKSNHSVEEMTEHHFLFQLRFFMTHPKGQWAESQMNSVDHFFNKYTPDRF